MVARPHATGVARVPCHNAALTAMRPTIAKVVLVAAAVTSTALALKTYQTRAPQPASDVVGTHTENGLAGFAKILCSGVFVSERTPEDVAHGSAYFFMPQAERDKVTYAVDGSAKLARASLGSLTREARYHGDQGCIIENPARPGIHFTPVKVTSELPDASTLPWPMGDRDEAAPAAAGVDKTKLDAAVDAYNQAIGSLESRVHVSARRMAELGVAQSVPLAELSAIERRTRTPRLMNDASLMNEASDAAPSPEPT